jgi:SAM-dependent methyltransferase
MTSCNVCGNAALSNIYESPANLSITTMNKPISGKTRVYFCDMCGHLQTSELPDLVAYYAQEYEINLSSEEDDQLYKVVDGKPVYRADHQAAVLMSKVSFQAGCRVLDYGCAKSPTLRKVLAAHPDIEPCLFDVTDKYIPFWERFPKRPLWSVHQPDPSWHGTMDVVLSFYALEHVGNLSEAMGNIKDLLRPGGIFYFLVPNVYQNVADFIVADHINHFSASSLRAMLQREGFGEIEVDDGSHEAAFVVRACYGTPGGGAGGADIVAQHKAAHEMAVYWKGIVGRIREFEASIGEGAVAIYGAGFYGSFISSVLQDPQRVCCIIDQNRHLQGRELNGKLILAPDQLPAEVAHILVGMNPRNARASIGAIPGWDSRGLSFFFL